MTGKLLLSVIAILLSRLLVSACSSVGIGTSCNRTWSNGDVIFLFLAKVLSIENASSPRRAMAAQSS